MLNRLTRRQLELYDRDGIVFPIPVLSIDEVAQFRGALDSLVNAHFGGSLKRVDNLHLFFKWAYDLATRDKLVEAVGDILGNDILIYATLIFSKPPKDISYVAWHQDSAYSNLHLTPSVTAWIALTPSNSDTGCMRVLPGSHNLGSLTHGHIEDSSNLLRRGECIDAEIDESLALDIVLRPGEASLHQSTLIHGSDPNRLCIPRIGFIIRFVTSQFMCPPGLSLIRVRGEGLPGFADLAKAPGDMNESKAFVAWRNFSASSAN